MPPRTLATLAHALSVAPDVDAALLALADALAEVDRFAQIALVRYDARREMLVDRLVAAGDSVARQRLDTTFDHLPTRERIAVSTGSTFVDFADHSDEFAPLFALKRYSDVGWLALRGMRFEGQLTGIIVLYETRKFFGTRTSERLAPAVTIVDLSLASGDWLHLLRRLRRQSPETKLIVLSLYDEITVARAALATGVDGFVLKRAIATDMLEAVNVVLAGKTFISPAVYLSART
jgi:CheY-like chemotaxis protein